MSGHCIARMTSFGPWMLGYQAGLHPLKAMPGPWMCMSAGKPFEHDLLAFPFTPMVLVVWPLT